MACSRLSKATGVLRLTCVLPALLPVVVSHGTPPPRRLSSSCRAAQRVAFLCRGPHEPRRSYALRHVDVLMGEGDFERKSEEELEHIQDCLQDWIDENDSFELEASYGVLTINLGSMGSFVINKHGVNRQVWVSSPVSGAARCDYDYDRGVWVNNRTDEPLRTMLVKDLSSLFPSTTFCLE